MIQPILPPVRRAAGFTLLELMVTLAIVAILAAVAYPSYMNSVRKGRRSDAADAATLVLQAQERRRSNNPAYTATLGDLPAPTTSAGGYYTLALSAATATGYTLTMTAVGGKSQASDTGCTSLVVAVAGGNPTYTPATCWSR